jgi:predicted  nucleic acid-binding Zn-ribbon protein
MIVNVTANTISSLENEIQNVTDAILTIREQLKNSYATVEEKTKDKKKITKDFKKKKIEVEELEKRNKCVVKIILFFKL